MNLQRPSRALDSCSNVRGMRVQDGSSSKVYSGFLVHSQPFAKSTKVGSSLLPGQKRQDEGAVPNSIYEEIPGYSMYSDLPPVPAKVNPLQASHDNSEDSRDSLLKHNHPPFQKPRLDVTLSVR